MSDVSKRKAMPEELAPCPFCGSHDIHNVSAKFAGPTNVWHAGDEIFAVNCGNCGASVPNRYTNQQVVDEWNHRTPAAQRPDAARLAQQEQEPVLWGVITPTGKFSPYAYRSKKDAERIASASHAGAVAAPLYADAPQRPWVGLTDEELQLIYDMGRTYAGMMEMVEAKLKEKNFD